MRDKNKTSKIIGAQIQKARIAKDITQEELAERINTTQNYISNIERGKRTPSLLTFLDIADALGFTTDEILMGVLKSGYIIKTTKLLQLINDLPEKDRNFVLNTIENMVHNLKEK